MAQSKPIRDFFPVLKLGTIEAVFSELRAIQQLLSSNVLSLKIMVLAADNPAALRTER